VRGALNASVQPHPVRVKVKNASRGSTHHAADLSSGAFVAAAARSSRAGLWNPAEPGISAEVEEHRRVGTPGHKPLAYRANEPGTPLVRRDLVLGQDRDWRTLDQPPMRRPIRLTAGLRVQKPTPRRIEPSLGNWPRSPSASGEGERLMPNLPCWNGAAVMALNEKVREAASLSPLLQRYSIDLVFRDTPLPEALSSTLT